jgi:hypothetical protein
MFISSSNKEVGRSKDRIYMLYLLDNFGDVANLSMNVKNPQ